MKRTCDIMSDPNFAKPRRLGGSTESGHLRHGLALTAVLVVEDPVSSKSDTRNAGQEDGRCAEGRKHISVSRQVAEIAHMVDLSS